MSDQNFKDYAKSLTTSDSGREAAITESMHNMKSRIKDVDVKLSEKTPAQKSVEAKPVVQPSSVDSVVAKYRSQIRQDSGVETPEVKNQPITKAGIENTKATIRALAGMRTGAGDVGEGSCTTPAGNGNVGNPGNYSANVASFTLEEYQAHINASFGIEEEVEEEILEEEVLEEDLTVVEVLSEALLDLEVPSWQEVDRVSREVCLEHAMTLRELNSEFRSVFGEYPDKWAKHQEEGDLVGFFPLEEAVRLNKIGQVYDVSFLFRGGTQRFSFFWPEASRPSFDDMQKAVEKFYPKARLLTFYLSKSNEPNFMVTVPPMNESYQFVSEDAWVELSEVDCETYEVIAEEVGEPVSPIVAREEGGYAVVIEDHDTGEQETVFFGEEIGSIYERAEKSNLVKRYAVSSMNEDWQKANRKDKTDGMSQKAVSAYRRENPGSKLKTAVTEKNPKGKRAKRRSSYCSRSAGQQKMHNIDCSKDRDKAICKARRRWNC
ncbi:hypothetical protein SCREM2_gp137 [Synechococcus phage S-CREM2]|nr:hypothetical protein SCREM2_gp137 [Synechococcus phage S-CREM2]